MSGFGPAEYKTTLVSGRRRTYRLAELGKLTQLRHLGLQQSHITDAGLKHLVGLTELKGLDLMNCRDIHGDSCRIWTR